jgi:hypothetical protein
VTELRDYVGEALGAVSNSAGKPNGHQSASAQPRFELIRFDAVQLGASPAYLVKGLIPRSGLTVIWGPPKCGKSFWTFDMAMHVARGTFYRGRRVQQGLVVYLALEGGHGFRARIEAYRRVHDINNAPFFLVTNRTSLVQDHGDLISDIRSQIGTSVPALVVIDTLNRSLAGSESKDEDMAAYIRAADTIREAFDCSIVVVHHCGVDGSRPRGHTSLTGAADAQHAVTREGGNIVVTIEWLKDGCEGDRIVSALEQIELGTDIDGELITSCVITPVDSGSIEQPTFERKVKGAAKVALDALYEAIDELGEIEPASTRIPSNVRTIPVVRWREYFDARTVNSDKKPDSRRRAFERAAERLQTLKIIGVWEGRVWIAGQVGQ